MELGWAIKETVAAGVMLVKTPQKEFLGWVFLLLQKSRW
jgi:hypothetical protein